jgi:hypothetical protein
VADMTDITRIVSPEEGDTFKVSIIEEYKDYSTTIPVKKIVSRLLNGIPQKYLRRLDYVLLINASRLNHDERNKKIKSRGKKVQMQKCQGLYIQPWKGKEAHIELFVDRIISPNGKVDPKIPLLLRLLFKIINKTNIVRDFRFSQTLYHEIGHHIHKTQNPEYKEREDVADVWAEKLIRYYFYHKYWYIFPAAWALVSIDHWQKILFRHMRKTRRVHK